MNREKIIRKVAAIAVVVAIAFNFIPFFNSGLRKVRAADEKLFYTVTYDSIFNSHAYKDANGKLGYCADQYLDGPGESGTKYHQISSRRSFDYLMYHGYPNTNIINGVKWSDNKAHDITQYAAWLLELGHSFSREDQSDEWNAAADKLFKGAAAYEGGGVEDGASTLWQSGESGKQRIIQPNLKGKVKLKKVSSNSEISKGNNCYSLKGALYGVYTNEGCTKKAGELRSDEKGESDTLDLSAGKYWVKEITAPKGFELDPKTYPVTVKPGETATVNVKDVPGSDSLSIRLEKLDKDTGRPASQGAATLAGAQFTVKYYDDFYTAGNLPEKAKRSWVIETKEKRSDDGSIHYAASLGDEYKVSGDSFYYDGGKAVLPYGTLSVEETKAPAGYRLAGSYLQPSNGGNKVEGIYVTQIKEKDGGVHLAGGNVYTVHDQVKRGGVKVKKRDLELGEATPQGAATLEGARFDIINANQNAVVVDGKSYGAGAVVKTLTTDEESNAETAADCLPYGDYKISESKAPEGYLNKGTVEKTFSISNEGEVVSLTDKNTSILNQVIRGGVEVQKRDFQSGETSPQGGATLEGAKFDIINMNNNAVVVDGKVYEPGAVVKTLITDEKGSAGTTADCLPYGNYKISESSAPKGYLNKGVVEREFTINNEGEIVSLADKDTSILNRVKRGDLEFVKIEGKTHKRMANIPFRITSMTTSESHVAVTDDNGCFSSESTVNAHSSNTNANDSHTEDEAYDSSAGIWFGLNEAGENVEVDDELGALPYDVYLVEELRCMANEAHELVPAFEIKISADKRVVKLGTVTNEAPDIPKEPEESDEPEDIYIHTIATNKDDRSKTVKADGKVTIVDAVTIKGLEVGKKYRLFGWEMVKSENAELKVDGKRVENAVEFIADTADKEVEIEFMFDASSLGGSDLVIFEELYDITEPEQAEMVAEHKDIENEEQTVFVDEQDIRIHTTATNKKDGSKTVKADGKVTIVDTVVIEGLKIGKRYQLSGWEMVKSENAELKADGKRVKSDLFFTADAKDKKVQIEFTFDASALGSQELVTFEELYDITEPERPEKVAVHKDIEDEGQTVSVLKKPQKAEPEETPSKPKRKLELIKTGDNNSLMHLVILMIISCVSIFTCVRIARRD